MSYIEKEKLIKADIASIENRVRHAFNQGYDLGYKEGKERAKSQESSKGRWIEHPHEAGVNWELSMYECSECHTWEEDDSNYCPNCGCRMVEPQESEVEE